jgi:hypothetical protein
LKIGRPSKSIDRKYQFDICLWLAMGKTTPQILDLMKDKYNLTMSYQAIDNYRYGMKWKKVIFYLRNRYLKNISRIPIAHKNHRLHYLQQAIDECLKWRTKSINQYGVIQEMKVGVLPVLVAEARKEVEGEKPLFDVSTHNYFTKIDIKHLDGKDRKELVDVIFGRNNGTVIRK